MLVLRKQVRFEEFQQGRTNALSAIKQIDKVVIKEVSGRIKYLPIIFKNVKTDVIHFTEEELKQDCA